MWVELVEISRDESSSRGIDAKGPEKNTIEFIWAIFRKKLPNGALTTRKGPELVQKIWNSQKNIEILKSTLKQAKNITQQRKTHRNSQTAQLSPKRAQKTPPQQATDLSNHQNKPKRPKHALKQLPNTLQQPKNTLKHRTTPPNKLGNSKKLPKEP